MFTAYYLLDTTIKMDWKDIHIRINNYVDDRHLVIQQSKSMVIIKQIDFKPMHDSMKGLDYKELNYEHDINRVDTGGNRYIFFMLMNCYSNYEYRKRAVIYPELYCEYWCQKFISLYYWKAEEYWW